ncbi:MAG: bacillithiol biosynthesis cysteine-adding enzyme BshC [Chitinophagales bacterium]|nr:bacillithiol biosynthesis cysteine-adding enzyme BshC [Chitinophagales bacterium]
MKKIVLPFPEVPQFAKTDVAYATLVPELRPFYQYTPDLDTFEAVIANRRQYATPRTLLSAVLTEQYAGLPQMAAVSANIEKLTQENTFTVITAHQPSILLGPLYFLYKAITAITLAEQIEARHGVAVIPVFVLGSEDHDLDELNKINLFSKKLVWETTESGAVGSMRTDGLSLFLEELTAIMGQSDAAQALMARVQSAYAPGRSIAQATRAMLHDLFGQYGLIVADGNDARLKAQFRPVMQDEMGPQHAVRLVNESIAALQAIGFKAQASPREINLFYLIPGMRERIVQEAGQFKVLNSAYTFTHSEILAEIEAHPERFSPNVVLRPLYQEMIFPNLAYVGGGGELAYWLERKGLFEHYGVPFPVLIRRNSVHWYDRDAVKKLEKFGFSAEESFQDTEYLIRQFIEKNAAAEISLEQEIADLKSIYQRLATKANTIDPTLEKSVLAESVKAEGALEQWEGRLRRAEKQKHEVTLNQLRTFKEKYFPGGGLQERSDNFLPYLLKYGPGFVEILKSALDPFDKGMAIIMMSDE